MKYIIFLLALSFFYAVRAQEVTIPYVENFIADGDPREWEIITDPEKLHADPFGSAHLPEDFSARIFLGWDERGICFLFEVTDNEIFCSSDNIYQSDRVEIFVSTGRETMEIIQLILTPNIKTPEIKSPVSKDYRRNPELRQISPEAGYVTRITNSGYVIEGYFSLLSLGKNPEKNETLAMQVYVADRDSGNESSQKMLTWFPAGIAHLNSMAMYSIKPGEIFRGDYSSAVRCWTLNDSLLNVKVFGMKPGDKVTATLSGSPYSSVCSFAEDDTILIQTLTSREIIYTDTLCIFINDSLRTVFPLILCPFRFQDHISFSRFEYEIRKFELFDQFAYPEQGGVLFTGSSSIKNWYTLAWDFPEWDIIQRGFGGSVSTDLLLYADRIIIPYKPGKIFIYEGDNDIPAGLSPETIRDNFLLLIRIVRSALPETRFYIISVKLSPARQKYWNSYIRLNSLLAEIASDLDYVDFIDIVTPMSKDAENSGMNYFVSDGIHLNEAGYEIWRNAILNY